MNGRLPIDRFRDALDAAGSTVRARRDDHLEAQCPAHDDRTPSLTVDVGQDGRVLVYCHAGCDLDAILAALKLTPADLFVPSDRTPTHVPVRHTVLEQPAYYPYTDEDGVALYRAVRKPGKTFRQERADEGRWIGGAGCMDGVRRVPYRLPQVAAQATSGGPVWIVEGEKDADRLAAAGIVATTNVGGAGKWNAHDDLAPHFAGAHVAILPDNDEAGLAHARDVAEALNGTAASVRVVTLPGLPPKGDVSDWLDAGHTVDELRQVARDTPPWTADAPDDEVETPAPTIEDRYPDLDWHALWDAGMDEPEWLVDQLVMARRAGAVFAKGKTGKSLVVLEMAACIATGQPFAGLDVQRRHVLYVDRENDPGDIIDRLKTFGFTPDQLAGWLHYKPFPPLPGLDGDDGGRELLELARHHDAGLVILDTIARLVHGPENDADTYRDYASRTGALLKADGIAAIRLDHAGADAARGQRGSTAKNDDVDVVWKLTGRGDDVQRWTFGVWEHTKRYRHGLDELRLHRGPDGRLHQPTGPTERLTTIPTMDERIEATVAAMDALDLPLDWGRKRLGQALRKAGHATSNDLIDAAKFYRRERSGDAEQGAREGARGTPPPGTSPGTSDAAPQSATQGGPAPYRHPSGNGTSGLEGGGCRTTPPPLRVGGPGTSPPAPTVEVPL